MCRDSDIILTYEHAFCVPREDYRMTSKEAAVCDSTTEFFLNQKKSGIMLTSLVRLSSLLLLALVRFFPILKEPGPL